MGRGGGDVRGDFKIGADTEKNRVRTDTQPGCKMRKKASGVRAADQEMTERQREGKKEAVYQQHI